jgi:cytochrome c oxidase assembly protein subunit 15
VWNAGIAVHFAHRVGAALVTLAILATAGHVWFHHRSRPELVRPATLLVFFVATQVTLGAFVVISGLQPLINTAHVVNGALVLSTSLVLTLRSYRSHFAEATAVSPVRGSSLSGAALGRSHGERTQHI